MARGDEPVESSAAPAEPAPLRSAWSSRWLLVAAAALWSTSGLFAKAPTFESWPAESRPHLLVFWRAAFATVVLVLVVRRPRWSWWLVPMVATFAAMNWSYLSALVYAEGSLAIFLQYTAPVWVFLTTALVLRQPITRRDWIFLGWAATALAIIIVPQLARADVRGVCYGLLSGVFYAGVVLSLRQLRSMDSAWLVFLNHAVTALVYLPIVILVGVTPSGVQWWFLAAFGILQMALPYLLFARAVRRTSGPEASTLALLEPVLLPVWVYLAWGRTPDYTPPEITTLIGGGMILASLVVRYSWGRNEEFNRLATAPPDRSHN
jgi:drug/metabolite transporter (DMT)-like permease